MARGQGGFSANSDDWQARFKRGESFSEDELADFLSETEQEAKANNFNFWAENMNREMEAEAVRAAAFIDLEARMVEQSASIKELQAEAMEQLGVVAVGDYVNGFRIFIKESVDKVSLDDQGLLHSIGDEPALIVRQSAAVGGKTIKQWMKHGEFSRDNGLFTQQDDSDKHWFRHVRTPEGVLVKQYHREDGPAFVGEDTEVWYQNDLEHRENGPAKTDDLGTKMFFQKGVYARKGGLPTVVHSDGSFERWLVKPGRSMDEYNEAAEEYEFMDPDVLENMNQEEREQMEQAIFDGSPVMLHSDFDMPAVKDLDGVLYWYENGRVHRDDDQPAIVSPGGGQQWYYHDRLHRSNGPAFVDEQGVRHWFWFGREISEQEHQQILGGIDN